MTTTRIIQLADGEELISYESERARRIVMDDPRRDALERRANADSALAARLESSTLRD